MISTLSEKQAYLQPGSDFGVDKFVRKKAQTIERESGTSCPDETVVIHSFPRTKLIPNVDPFTLKLETYLRIHKIPYKLDFKDCCKGPNKKTPWIEYNGGKMGDSQLIIQHFNDVYNVDLNEHLTKEERASAWAIQKWLEEYTYWLNYHSRWYIFWDDLLVNMFQCPAGINKFIRIPARWWIKKQTKAVGIGCHSDKEVQEMMVKDLRSFAKILDDKKYLMGDQISEVDCAAFGILSQVRWCTPHSCPGYQLLTGGELQNVMDYLDRIKDIYWLDWDKLLLEAKC